jgi:RAD51-like protein 2
MQVVLMNQVTTKIDNTGGSTLVPALGQTWGHICTNRVILYWKDNKRFAHLSKSPSHEARTGMSLC